MTKETKWSIDKTHSEIGFKVRHLMIAHVRGTFKTFDADIKSVEKDFKTADIDLWVDPSSISTGDLKRDEHLKSPDFFDVLNHKQINFTSNTIINAENGDGYEMWGDLTIKGITKHIKLNVVIGGIVKDPWGNEKAGIEISGTICRSDWGLTWNATLETGGFMVSDEVHILCEIELIKSINKLQPIVLENTTLKSSN